MTVMVNRDVNGILVINKYLLNDILKEKWVFVGFVSDWEDFIKLHKEHRKTLQLKIFGQRLE